MGPKLRGRRIVLGVADEPLRDTIEQTLSREGAAVEAHATARSLLQSIAADRPEACIVDVDLPDLGGRDLVDEIRRTEATVPILLVSAHVFPEESPDSRSMPTLRVPFRRKELLDLLQGVLSARGTRS